MADKSKLEDFPGKIKFLHAVTLNKFNKWSVVFYPEPKALERIRDLQSQGLKNVLKKDEDGYYIQFSREPSKVMRGETVKFDPPKVVDNNNNPIDGSTVGWSSDGIVRLQVYTHGTPSGGRAAAARFDSVKITNLIPFEKKEKEEKEPDPW